MADKQLHPRQEFAGHGADAEAEEILDLGGSDEYGDAVCEPDDDRTGNEPHRRPRPVRPMTSRMMPAMSVTMARPGNAKAGNDAGDDDDESAGGAADLGARAAEGRDEEAGYDGGIESGLGSNSGGDAEGHGERQSHESDSDAGEKVVHEHLPAVLA